MNEPLLRIVISQTWQIAVLTIVVAGIVRIVARNRPHLAHALWILVLIKCVTPPLWGHSLGVFSQIMTLAAPRKVAAQIEDANLRVDTIEVDEQANPEASLEMPETADSEALISANDELLEPQFDAEPQRREVAEEAWDDESQTDLASLGLNDSALEIPPLEPEVDAHVAEQPASPVIDQLPSLLFGGFLIGSIITLTTMVIRCLRCLRQIRLHQTTEFDDVLRDRIQQLAKQLRIRRIPRIVVSDVLFGPAVLGLLRHTIVLPRCLFDHVGDGWRAERRKSPDDVTLSVMQRQQSEDLRPAARQNVFESGPADSNLQFLDPILAHELLHIRRGDLRTGTLQAIVQSLWWFHPAVWFANRWLSREAERCCDEQVIAELGCTPAHYARSLLSVIECKHRLQPIPVFPGMKPVEITSQRMERIMSLKNGLKKRTPIWCWLMIVALAFVVLPGAVAKTSVDEIESNETNADTKLLPKNDVEAQLPEFDGNLFWNDADLRKYLGEREQANDVDIAATLAADCETIKSKYRGVGYFDVEVEATTSPADNPTNRRVQFQIKEGRRYKIREIRYESNARINASDLQQGSILKSGDMYSSYQTSKDMQRIQERYKDLRFKRPAINPVPHFSEESGVVDLVFEIDENPVASYSRKTYDVSDLLTRLSNEQGIPAADANRQLHRVLETSIWGLYDFSDQPVNVPSRERYIYLNGDQLAVSNSDEVHARISEELSRFRKLGFKRYQVTARCIAGSAEEINAILSAVSIEPPFAETENEPVVENSQKEADRAKSELHGATTYRPGTIGFASRSQALAIAEAARAKTDSLIVSSPNAQQAFNGQTAIIGIGETKADIVMHNETSEPTISALLEGLKVHVTPAFVDDGVVRLQCVSGFDRISEMPLVDSTTPDSESSPRLQTPKSTSRRVQSTVELRNDQSLFLTGIATSQDGNPCAVLVVIDAVPISMKPLTSLIRLDESFIPSPGLVLTGDTVLAYVADKKITFADVANGLLERLKKDPTVTPEQRQKTLLDTVVQQLPRFLYDELVLHEFRRTLTPDKEAEIRKSLEPAFSEVLEKFAKDNSGKDMDDVERILQELGFSLEMMRESFMRRQFVVGYSQSLPVGSPIQNQGAIEAYCRQLLFEARLRQRVTLAATESFSVEDLLGLGKDRGISISPIGISDEDFRARLATDIVNQPLLDVIRAIVEPHGFQVAVGKEEVVLTAKPKSQAVAPTPESASLHIPAMPLPEWIRNSSDPLVKIIWDARNASQRRLLMTDQRTPWQFMNGLAALRGNFLIREGDEAVVGLDWLQNCKAFPGQQWFQKSEFGGQPNPNPAPLWFDGHAAQFVATLAMNGVPLDATFATADGTITVGDMVKHLQMTVNEKKLTPWTLIALSKYLSPDAEWVSTDGEHWNIERVLKQVLDGPSETMYTTLHVPLVFARDQYLRTGRPLQGVWLEAQDRIASEIQEVEPRGIASGEFRPYSYRSPRPVFRTSHPRLASPPFPISQPDREVLYGNQRDILTASMSYDFRKTPGREALLLMVTALPDKQLQENWLRNAIEEAANELIADHGKKEIRSPFYETTQALSIYLERVAASESSKLTSDSKSYTVEVKGLVRNPGTYQSPKDRDLRVTDAIQLAGGATDETVKSVFVIRKPRNAEKSAQAPILRLGYNNATASADPNIFLAPGDEVLLQPAELLKKPLSTSIRLDDNFVLSRNAPITSDSVIVYLNDRPITVEKFIGSGWARLEKTPGITDSLKRQVVFESVASRLPEYVFQEIILQYFKTDVPILDEPVSPRLKEMTDKKLAEVLENPTKTDPHTQARTILTLLEMETTVQSLRRQVHANKYILESYKLHRSSAVASNKSAVIKHVQELVTTARLRSLVSVDYTNTTLAEVRRSVKKNHDIEIKVNSLHEQISQRIFDQPGAIDFHAENKPLGEALTAIVSPFGLTLSLDGSNVLLQFADSELAMEKFRSLPSPPSFGVFGVLKNPGWHPLTEEIRLLEALAIAGDIENSDSVSIEITNPDILSGKAKPVSMSLRFLKNDTSGKLNRVVKDGDIINVVRNSSAEAARAKAADRVKMQGKGITADSGVGTFHIDEASSLQLEQAMAKRRNIKLRMLKNAAQLSTASSTDEIVQLERKKRELELELENVPTVTLSGTGIVQAASVSVEGTSGKRTNSNDDETQKENNGTHGIAPASTNASLELCSYPVADLVNYRQPVIAKVVRSSAEEDPARQSVISASTLLSTPEQSANQGAPKPRPQLPLAQDTPLNLKADFAPLTELIKATVQPKSWDPLGRALIAVDEKTSSLVIRQTPSAHGEICDLLSQLRSADDHMVSIQSLILKLTDDAQLKWLGAQCSLHTFPNETQWALLSKERSQVLTRELLELKPEVVSRPKMVTISAQMAAIQIGQSNKIDGTTTGIRMEMTPHLLPGNKIIRLQHAAQIGKLSAEVLLPVESLVGSGQTLLLLLDAASENKEPEVPTSKYLLLITPEYVPLVEEEETLSKPHPDTKTELNP